MNNLKYYSKCELLEISYDELINNHKGGMVAGVALAYRMLELLFSNINNIDNYSLSDLKALRENIERISTFGFNEEETILEDTIEKKGPVLKMTLDNKRK